jgi:LPS-assembly lipoprotein
MSLFDARKAVVIDGGLGARFRSLLACALAASALAGCGESGFRPLYGSSAVGGANVETKLAGVDVAPIPGRLGQRIRNELIFDVTGGGAASTPTYRLEIAVKENVISTLVKTDGDALSQIYTADATFNLIRLSDKKVVLKGTSFGRAGFERNPSIFSNVRAQDDAQNRAAHSIGLEMKTRLAAYLATAS